MKIKNDPRLPGVLRTKSGASSSSTSKSTSSASDRVNISRSRDDVGQIKSMLQQIPESGSSEKVPQIKQQIDDGSYHVESRVVAEKMLNYWSGFNGA